MMDRFSPSSLLGFETFGTAIGLAVVAGALSLLTPALSVLTGTLAALAIAAAGAAAYLDPLGPLGPFRGLILGVSLVPLWVAERGIARRGPQAAVAVP